MEYPKYALSTIVRLEALRRWNQNNYTEREMADAGIDMSSWADTNPRMRTLLEDLPPEIKNAPLGALLLRDAYDPDDSSGVSIEIPRDEEPPVIVELNEIPVQPTAAVAPDSFIQ